MPPSFGFKGPLADDLTAKAEAVKQTDLPTFEPGIADSIAEAGGFPSREAYAPVRRDRSQQEATQALTMRLPQSQLRRFVAYAEREGLSYPKALVRLLDTAAQ
jgi:hypothetical protein